MDKYVYYISYTTLALWLKAEDSWGFRKKYIFSGFFSLYFQFFPLYFVFSGAIIIMYIKHVNFVNWVDFGLKWQV